MSPNTASLIFAGVVAVATVAYVLLTWRLVTETRLLRKQQFRPQVTVCVEPGQAALGLIDLVVENIGSGPAYDLTFTYEPDLELETNPTRHLSDIGFLTNGARFLGPRNELRTYLMRLYGLANETLSGKDRPRFRLSVGYKDGLGTKYTEAFEVDFSHLAGILRVGTPPLPEIAKHLDIIASALSRLTRGFDKLKVVQYSPGDVDRERDEFRLAQLSGQLIEDATKDPEPPAQK